MYHDCFADRDYGNIFRSLLEHQKDASFFYLRLQQWQESIMESNLTDFKPVFWHFKLNYISAFHTRLDNNL